jgi:hypothetical protein
MPIYDRWAILLRLSSVDLSRRQCSASILPSLQIAPGSSQVPSAPLRCPLPSSSALARCAAVVEAKATGREPCCRRAVQVTNSTWPLLLCFRGHRHCVPDICYMLFFFLRFRHGQWPLVSEDDDGGVYFVPAIGLAPCCPHLSAPLSLSGFGYLINF